MDIKKYKQFLRPELHQMLDDIVQSTGTVIKKLPAVNITPDGARFLIENTDGTHTEYMKINGKFKQGSTFE